MDNSKDNFMRVAVVATDFEGAQGMNQFKVVKKPELKEPMKRVVPEITIEPVQPEIEEIPAISQKKEKNIGCKE
ncbi:MAG: hypothetical protein ABDH29_02050 [Aquificaceae bacterium]